MADAAQHFFRWWKQGLLAAIPGQFRPNRPQAQITRTTSGFHVVRRDTGEQAELLAADAEAPGPAAIKLDGCEVTLRLAAEDALQGDLRLPAAAERNLDAVLGHEIERHTPFTREQIYYSGTITARDNAQSSISVRFCAVPRSRLEQALQNLDRFGIRPHRACVNEQQNLLPPARRPPALHGTHKAIVLPLLLAVALALLHIYMPLWQQHRALQQLNHEIQQMAPVAAGLKQLQDEHDIAAQRSNFLNTQRAAHVPAIALLQHLSGLLPDSTALQSLKIDKGYITLAGESENASGLIALLEGSPMLGEPSFRSPVIHGDKSGRERFTITATLQQQPPDGDG